MINLRGSLWEGWYAGINQVVDGFGCLWLLFSLASGVELGVSGELRARDRVTLTARD
ncbi:MAG: hypothetical protein COB94_003060 [Gammaproteobacteria bacterium]|nr:hypothetical protein [Gammaproteobacteria bacterium]